MQKVGFLGAGNMASAIIRGILHAGMQVSLCVYDLDAEKSHAFDAQGVTAMDSAGAVIAASDVVFFCVKPQNFEKLFAEISGVLDESKLYVSIAAGINDRTIKRLAGRDGLKIITAMPNTPLLRLAGCTALAQCEGVSDDEFAFVEEIFASCGLVKKIAKDRINETIPVHGSSPAFIYLFADLIAQNAGNHGIEYQTALEMFCQTLIGSAKMLLESGETPAELIRMVSSPGGTTISGLDALHANGFDTAVERAFDACVKRAYELGK